MKKVFWIVAMAGLVMARVVDSVRAQKVEGIITGKGCDMIPEALEKCYFLNNNEEFSRAKPVSFFK